jgi:O-antigen/teichoic acid export membrane protein
MKVSQIENGIRNWIIKCIATFAHVNNNEFMRKSTVVFLVSLVGCFFSYLYQIYMGRELGPEGYGAFGSLFAIFYLISVFTNTVQIAGTRFVSIFYARGEKDHIGSFLWEILKKAAIFGVIGFGAFYLISPSIASFLRIDSSNDVSVLGTIVLFAVLTSACMGAIQGLQRFYTFALLGTLTMVLKFLFGVLLVDLGYGISGALGAVTLSNLLIFIISVYLLSPFLKNRKIFKEHKFSELYVYSMPALLVMLCLAIPSNVDVILAKHFFNENDAGLYTAASVLGKIVLFLPGAITTVMFPKAVEMSITGRNIKTLLNRSLIYTAFLSGSAAATFAFFPGLLQALFGRAYVEAAQIIGIYVAAMAIFSLTWVLAQYCLAVGKLKYAYIIIFFTIIELIAVTYLHATIIQMAQVILVLNIILLVASYLFIQSSDGTRGGKTIADLDNHAGI